MAEDTPTVILCLSCKGSCKGSYERMEESEPGRYRQTVCRWCTQGGMDRDQVLAFLRYRREHGEKL